MLIYEVNRFDGKLGVFYRFFTVCMMQVSAAQRHADESKVSAEDILLKANQSRARVEQTNQELRELIQQIRDFLTRKHSHHIDEW